MARTHAEVEERSLALHRAVAERLREQPEQVTLARQRVASWQRERAVSDAYARAWSEALDGPWESLLALLTDAGPAATALRQVSPFAGILSPRERWRILEDWSARRETQCAGTSSST
jgi:hypothetical protein